MNGAGWKVTAFTVDVLQKSKINKLINRINKRLNVDK